MTNVLISIVTLLVTNQEPVSVTVPLAGKCWPEPVTNYAPGLVKTQTWAEVEWNGERKRLLLEETPRENPWRLYVTNGIDMLGTFTNIIIWPNRTNVHRFY